MTTDTDTAVAAALGEGLLVNDDGELMESLGEAAARILVALRDSGFLVVPAAEYERLPGIEPEPHGRGRGRGPRRPRPAHRGGGMSGLGPVFDEPWTGATGDADTDIARMERAAGKFCGWCGRQLQAWEDLREWACTICAWSGSDTPWEAPE